MKPSVTEAVAAAIRAVLADTGRPAGPIEPQMRLAGDVGLDSLDLAQAIVLLERSLGVDPFRSAPADGASRPLRTVSDLVAIYEAALSQP